MTDQRPDIHDAACAYCGARPGAPCVVRGTSRATGTHAKRAQQHTRAVRRWWAALRHRCYTCEHYTWPVACAVYGLIDVVPCSEHRRG